jgi:hypothetical protein
VAGCDPVAEEADGRQGFGNAAPTRRDDIAQPLAGEYERRSAGEFSSTTTDGASMRSPRKTSTVTAWPSSTRSTRRFELVRTSAVRPRAIVT